MCSKIIVLPFDIKMTLFHEPFAGGKIDCSEVDEANTQDQRTCATPDERDCLGTPTSFEWPDAATCRIDARTLTA